MKLKLFPFFLLLFCISSFGQKLEYSTLTIPDSLKQNANAVVRLSQLEINITSQKSMTIKSTIVTTVLNELGLRNLDLVESYDKDSRISYIEATAYDATGKQLKVYKRRDFKDQSAVDDGSVFSDNRMLYLDYTPITYPFTIVFESETEHSNTAFIPAWSPIEAYLVSTEKTFLRINYKPELHLQTKEFNFSNKYPVDKKETSSCISYSAKNLVAKKYEDLAPSFDSLFPRVMFGLELFNLEGILGNAKSWKELGKWFYEIGRAHV